MCLNEILEKVKSGGYKAVQTYTYSNDMVERIKKELELEKVFKREVIQAIMNEYGISEMVAISIYEVSESDAKNKRNYADHLLDKLDCICKNIEFIQKIGIK
jgi:histidinol dehydrogenase